MGLRLPPPKTGPGLDRFWHYENELRDYLQRKHGDLNHYIPPKKDDDGNIIETNARTQWRRRKIRAKASGVHHKLQFLAALRKRKSRGTEETHTEVVTNTHSEQVIELARKEKVDSAGDKFCTQRSPHCPPLILRRGRPAAPRSTINNQGECTVHCAHAINVRYGIECEPSCPVKPCENQLIRNSTKNNAFTREEAKVEVRKTGGIWDRHVVAAKFIPKGTFIGEYKGTVTLETESKGNVPTRSKYTMVIATPKPDSQTYVISANAGGSKCRYINHSCDRGNLATIVRQVDGYTRVGFVATTDIPAGAELTYQYHWDPNQLWFKCKCGAVNCVHRSVRTNCTNQAIKGGVDKRHGGESYDRLSHSEERVAKMQGGEHRTGDCRYSFVRLDKDVSENLSELPKHIRTQRQCLFTCSADVYNNLSAHERQRLQFFPMNNGETYSDGKRTQRSVHPENRHWLGMRDRLERIFQAALEKPDHFLQNASAITTEPGALRQQCHNDYNKQVTDSGEGFLVIFPLGEECQSIIVKRRGELSRVRLIPHHAFIGRADLEHAGSEDPGTRLHFEFLPSRLSTKDKGDVQTYFVEDTTYPDSPPALQL
jgi:hypothetical protein